MTCPDKIEGPHIAFRLGSDLPGPFHCTLRRGHLRAHYDLTDLDRPVWWWRWGNDRILMRAKVKGEAQVRS